MKTNHFSLKMEILFLFFLISSTFTFSQQYLVNSEWTATFGNDTSQYFYRRATVKTDASRNVYTLGSSISTTGHDILLMKQNYSGDTLFLISWNGDGNGEDFGLDMVVDTSTEYVYVVGGSRQDISGVDSLDPVIVAFDNSGSEMWHTYAASSSDLNEAYFSIVCDGAGNLFTCGVIGGAGLDYYVSAYDLYGTEWNYTSYNYVGASDVALKIIYDPITPAVLVAGISESSYFDWDYYVISYDPSTLSVNSDNRSYAGSGQTHRPTDFVYADNRYYITGGINPIGGSNCEIKTICLDSTLTLVWDQTYSSPDSLEDISSSVKVDSSGNVYITGKTTHSNNTTDMVTIKYDNTGNEMWVNYYDGADGTRDDVGYDLELKDDNVFVTGYITNSSNSLLYNTMCYDTAGSLRWQKLSIGGATYQTDLAIDGDGNLILGAPLFLGLYTEKFSPYSNPMDQIIDTIGGSYRQRDLIIKFMPSVVKTDMINNKRKCYGSLEDFLQDSTITKLGDKMGINLARNDDFKVAKIFRNVSVADSMFISHGEDTVYSHEPWSMLRIILPDSTDPQGWIDSLSINLTDTNDYYKYDLFYVGKNYIYQLCGNPPSDFYYYYGDQNNLLSYTYPYAHMNAQDAWGIFNSCGAPFIKVGIYDTGVEWDHEDFSIDGSETFDQSVAQYGYDYTSDASITASTTHNDDDDHGTHCAGIIGAIRDNVTGMAGIAGGNGGAPGVRLYNMKTNFSSDQLANAIFEGATTYGLDVSNHSYMGPTWELATYYAHHFAWEMGVVQAVSRGNFGDAWPGYTENAVVYPSCYENDWILCVGANGNNGLRMSGSNGPGGDQFHSMNGQPYIDCTAPGTSDVVQITTSADESNNIYESFYGTSAASPHVAGLGGLMLSYYNSPSNSFQNLCHDDVEHFVKKYASDRGASGYETDNGYGILDAGAIFYAIDQSNRYIQHYSNASTDGNVSNTVVWNDVLILLESNYYPDVAAGWYKVDVVECVSAFSPPMGPSTSIIDAWALPSKSKGFRTYQAAIYPTLWDEYCELVSFTSTTVTLKTYKILLEERLATFGNSAIIYSPSIYLGAPYDDIKLSYGVLVEGGIGVEDQHEQEQIKVFPNPTTGIVNIQFSKGIDGVYEIFDILGKKMCGGNLNAVTSTLDISTFPSATYYLKITTGETTKAFPIIKQ